MTMMRGEVMRTIEQPGERTGVTYGQVAELRAELPRLNWDEIARRLGCSRRTAISVYQRGAGKEAA